jgi:GDP-L-galactose phosphorylase
MLTIKRVETVVSMHQQLEQVPGCGRDCLGTCCIPGAKLPLYAFGARQSSGSNKRAHTGSGDHCVPDIVEDSDVSPQENYFLDELLLAQWEDRMARGLFRYDVTACETKMLPGDYGFIAQLNEGRHLQKRPTEFRVDQVLQPFDPMKFNFMKIGQEEVLFQFMPNDNDMSEYYEKATVSSSLNVVAINVSPIEYGHILLVPRVLDRLPQRIDQESFLLALYMAVEANNPYFRLGYNSLGAFATINHLHFQAYYLAAPFPIERAPATRVSYGRKKSGVKVYELTKFPVRGLVFEMCNSMVDLSIAVANACIYLQNENIPYNVLITDRGSRVFLLPQCFAERQARGEVDEDILETQVNPAVWEISGHIVLKRRKDYDLATEDYAWRLLAEISLSQERFEEVKAKCLKAAFLGISVTSDYLSVTSKRGSFDFMVNEDMPDKDYLKTNSLDAVVPNHGDDLSVEA